MRLSPQCFKIFHCHYFTQHKNMNANNGTVQNHLVFASNDTIDFIGGYLLHSTDTEIVIYYVLLPAITVLGIIGNCFSVYGLWKKSYIQLSLWYQIFIVINATLCLVNCICVYTVSKYLKIFTSSAPLILRKSFFVANLANRFIFPLCSFFGVGNILFNFAMCLDRLYAILLPLKYRLTNKRKNVITTVVTVVFLSTVKALFESFRYDVSFSQSSDAYISTPNSFVQDKFGKVFSLVTSLLYFGVVILVFMSNIVVACKLKKFKTQQLVKFRNSTREPVKKRGHLDEYCLGIMLLIQGSIFFIGEFPSLINYVLAFFSLSSEWFGHFANFAQTTELALASLSYICLMEKSERFIKQSRKNMHTVQSTSMCTTEQ